MQTVNTKSEKILKEAEPMRDKPFTEEMDYYEEQEEETALQLPKNKKEKYEFLSDDAVQTNHKEWLLFSQIVSNLSKN